LEGRFMGAAAVARLHADPAFRAELAAAISELAAARSRGLAPSHDCQSETEALEKGLFPKQ
jgi:acid phosphatase (class A)